MYHIYSIESSVTSETYVGVTQYPDHIERYHESCSEDGQLYLYTFIRSHGGWKNFYVRHASSHDTYEDAKNKKVSGSLNIYDQSNSAPTIYKIFCRDQSIKELYVGQTINFDSRRFSHFTCSMYRHLKLYEFIRSHGGWDNWKMEIVRQYPFCRDREDLDRLEWYWWKKLDGELNSITPGHVCSFEKTKYKEKLIEKTEEFEQMVIDDVPRKNFFINSISLEI